MLCWFQLSFVFCILHASLRCWIWILVNTVQGATPHNHKQTNKMFHIIFVMLFNLQQHVHEVHFHRESWSGWMLVRWWLAMEASSSPWRREATSRPDPGRPRPPPSTPKQVGSFNYCMDHFFKWTSETPEASQLVMLTFRTFCNCVMKWGSCTGSSSGPGPTSCRPSPSTPAMINWRTEATSSPSQWVQQ